MLGLDPEFSGDGDMLHFQKKVKKHLQQHSSAPLVPTYDVPATTGRSPKANACNPSPPRSRIEMLGNFPPRMEVPHSDQLGLACKGNIDNGDSKKLRNSATHRTLSSREEGRVQRKSKNEKQPSCRANLS